MCTTQYQSVSRLLDVSASHSLFAVARSLAFLPKSHVRHVLMRFMSCIFWSIALIYLQIPMICGHSIEM